MSADPEPGASPSPQQLVQRALIGRQKRFVEEYLVDLNGYRAALRAGYSERCARSIASRNLSNPKVMIAVDMALASQPGITRTRVIDELGKIAFANMLDFIEIGEDGAVTVQMRKVTRDEGAAISEVTTERYTEGRGEDAKPVTRVRLKLADKLAALDKLGKVLGMWKERHEFSGPGGTPLAPVLNVSYGSQPAPASQAG